MGLCLGLAMATLAPGRDLTAFTVLGSLDE